MRRGELVLGIVLGLAVVAVWVAVLAMQPVH